MKKIIFMAAAILFLSLTAAPAQSTEKELILETGAAPHSKIDDIYRRFSEAYRKLDFEAVTDLYTDDALYLAPGSDVKRGREKILKQFSGYFNSVKNSGGSLAISFRILERRVSKDLAYDVGIYTITEKTSKGESRAGRGKFVVVARKMENGDWRFQVDGYSSLPDAQPN